MRPKSLKSGDSVAGPRLALLRATMALESTTARPADSPNQDDFADELLELRRMLAGLHLDARDTAGALETTRTRLNALTLRASRVFQAFEARFRDGAARGFLAEIRGAVGEAQHALVEPARDARALSRIERARGALLRALGLLAQMWATRGPGRKSAQCASEALLPMRVVLAAAARAAKSETCWFVAVSRAEIGLLLAHAHAYGRMSDSLLVELVGLDARLGESPREARERVLAFLGSAPSSPEPAAAPRR
jgi:hypothetical protein